MEDPTVEDRLSRLAAAITDSPHNLVSRSAKAVLATRHIPECVDLAALLPPGGPLLDIGSGGGLPGLVIAIVRPDIDVHLLEATQKKAAFLRQTADEVAPSVTVHACRAEELARGEGRGRYPMLTARAVAPLDRLIGWAAPLLAPAGVLYAIKGERWSEEVAATAVALDRHRMTIVADPSSDPRLAPDPDRPQAPRVVMLARTSS